MSPPFLLLSNLFLSFYLNISVVDPIFSPFHPFIPFFLLCPPPLLSQPPLRLPRTHAALLTALADHRRQSLVIVGSGHTPPSSKDAVLGTSFPALSTSHHLPPSLVLSPPTPIGGPLLYWHRFQRSISPIHHNFTAFLRQLLGIFVDRAASGHLLAHRRPRTSPALARPLSPV